MKLLRKDLVKICGLDRQAVKLWKRDGLRVSGFVRGQGVPADQFESDDVLRYLEGRGVTAYKSQRKKYHQRLLKLKVYLKEKGEGEKTPKKKRGRPRKTDPDKKNISSGTPQKAVNSAKDKAIAAKKNGELNIDPDADIHEITEMLTRVREAEKQSHDAWQEASNDENPIAELNLQKIWMEFIANRTKLEKQIPDILLAKKLYRPVDEIKQNCARIGTVFKNSLLGAGATVRAQITPFVKTQEDAVLIEGMITKTNKQALHKAMTDLGKV